MIIHLLTLFPEIVEGYTGASIAAKAVDKGLLTFNIVDIRDFARDKHRTCDDYPYGGGPGMVLKAEPLAAALDSVEGESLVPAIRNQTRKEREALYFSYRHFQRALRTRRWKLILYNVHGEKNSQLFDLENDPWETINLAEEPSQTERIRTMTDLLKSMMEKTGDPVRLDMPDWGVSE